MFQMLQKYSGHLAIESTLPYVLYIVRCIQYSPAVVFIDLESNFLDTCCDSRP